MTTTALPIFTIRVEGAEALILHVPTALQARETADILFPHAHSIGIEHTSELAEAAEARRTRKEI